ncbi:hypothetical protein VNO77_07583 [Canavalia gladiata]|uniref:Uncharacterized protein n=1 Tax=Canavalia gladiata TaxID=3824 RepID=A0AAN9MDA1_CANGL
MTTQGRKTLGPRAGESLACSLTIQVDNVINYLSSNGIRAIAGHSQRPEQGTNWNVKPPQRASSSIPKQVRLWENSDGTTTLSFLDYEERRETRGQSEQEDDDREIMGGVEEGSYLRKRIPVKEEVALMILVDTEEVELYEDPFYEQNRSTEKEFLDYCEYLEYLQTGGQEIEEEYYTPDKQEEEQSEVVAVSINTRAKRDAK